MERHEGQHKRTVDAALIMHAAAGWKIQEAGAPSWRLWKREDEMRGERERFIILRFQIVITFVRSLAASFRSRAHTSNWRQNVCDPLSRALATWLRLKLPEKCMSVIHIWRSCCLDLMRAHTCARERRERIFTDQDSRQAHLAHNHVFYAHTFEAKELLYTYTSREITLAW